MSESAQTFSIGDCIVERPTPAGDGFSARGSAGPLGAVAPSGHGGVERQGRPWSPERADGATASEGAPAIEWETVVVTRNPATPGGGKPAQKSKKRPMTSRRPTTAIVGGVSHVAGGWGEYEAARRAAEREMQGVYGGSADGKTYYAGRTVIGGKDAAESLLTSRPPRALQKAAEHLAKSLGALEDTLCDPDDDGLWACEDPSVLSTGKKSFVGFVVPSLISEDVDSFVANGDYTSPDDLYTIADAAISTAAALGAPMTPMPALKGRGIPPLPARMVPANDSGAVAKLEAASIPYVSRVEELQAAVASVFDKVADVIDKKLASEKQ